MTQDEMRHYFRFIFVFSILGLSACTAPAPSLTSCEGTGMIGSGKVPNPTQGFPISFQYYLPPCHDEAAHARFPVIYLLAMPFEPRLEEEANTPMSLAERLIRAREL